MRATSLLRTELKPDSENGDVYGCRDCQSLTHGCRHRCVISTECGWESSRQTRFRKSKAANVDGHGMWIAEVRRHGFAGRSSLPASSCSSYCWMSRLQEDENLAQKSVGRPRSGPCGRSCVISGGDRNIIHRHAQSGGTRMRRSRRVQNGVDTIQRALRGKGVRVTGWIHGDRTLGRIVQRIEDSRATGSGGGTYNEDMWIRREDDQERDFGAGEAADGASRGRFRHVLLKGK